MTHDHETVLKAAGGLLPAHHGKKCSHCGCWVNSCTWHEISHRLEDHKKTCPLRIVIEAALANTATRENDESESETKVRLRNAIERLGLYRDEVLGLLKEQGSRNIKELTHGQALAMVTALERRFASSTESEGA